jgi:hypothetical protein
MRSCWPNFERRRAVPTEGEEVEFWEEGGGMRSVFLVLVYQSRCRVYGSSFGDVAEII